LQLDERLCSTFRHLADVTTAHDNGVGLGHELLEQTPVGGTRQATRNTGRGLVGGSRNGDASVETDDEVAVAIRTTGSGLSADVVGEIEAAEWQLFRRRG
jgi:hypothetical protein